MAHRHGDRVMPHYVGLDVSQKTTSICVVDGTGRHLWRGSCRSEPEGIFGALAQHAGTDSRIGRCQSKIEYSARMPDPNFANIDFPRFFGPDPCRSTAISGIQNFALTRSCQTKANWSPLTRGRWFSGGADLTPRVESGGSIAFENVPAGEVAFLVEEVVDGGVNGGELL